MPIAEMPNNGQLPDENENYIKNTVFQFVHTDDKGLVDGYVDFGAKSNRVYYEGENSEIGPYTLSQLFEAFIDFLKTNHYLYMGDEQPVNSNTKIWIDTSETNENLWKKETTIEGE